MPNESENQRLKVFISYSRSDETFARDLLAGLEAAGFQPFLDTHDIVGGEAWESRLQRLIETADAVVFVLSPDSIISKKCAWEIDLVVQLKKRLMPVMWRHVGDDDVPLRLRQLNYIFFTQANSFGGALLALSNALKTDVDWIREHTRIGEAALRWKERGRPNELLFGVDELANAQEWVRQQPKFAAEPTLLMLEFLRESDQFQMTRQAAEQQRLEQLIAANSERETALAKEEAALARAQLAFKRVQRWQAATSVLLASVMGLMVGTYYWHLIATETNWFFTARPFIRANFERFVLSRDQERQLKPADVFRECAAKCPEMVVIPAGRFTMGSYTGPEDSEEKPLHEVSIPVPFAVSKHLVTFSEWDACAAVRVCPRIRDSQYGREDQPVINVTWDDAMAYVAWLRRATGKPYRLLSEAEWEYAARAGTTTLYPWGDDPGGNMAHCLQCKSAQDTNKPAPVGSFPPNPFGLYDMHGNVQQWCEDNWHESYRDAPDDGRVWHGGIKSLRVVRGGSWSKDADYMRSANRGYMQDDNRSDEVGIRVARTLTTGSK